LVTNDNTGSRNAKILKFFFGVMKNTELISGEFKVSGENNCSTDVNLNRKTANIPLQNTINKISSISFDRVIN
jgi:hypothetical protein